MNTTAYSVFENATINVQKRDEDRFSVELWSDDGEKTEMELESIRMGGRLIWNEGEQPEDGRIASSGVEIDSPWSEAWKLSGVDVVVSNPALVVLSEQIETVR